jgi:hypothetical protein
MRAVDIEPTESIPQSFEDYLSYAERSKILRDTAAGRFAGKPILAEDMPKTHRFFSTWSLFLISNPVWLQDDGAKAVDVLRQAYWGFARAIGNRHAAVWFAKDATNEIDAARCADYAQKLGLDLGKSPHILVTNEYPGIENSFTPSILLELNGLSPRSTQALLTELASQLVNSKLNETDLKSAQWWLGWRDAATKALEKLREVAKWVTITIDEKGSTKVKITVPK